MTLAERLAAFATRLEFEDISAEVSKFRDNGGSRGRGSMRSSAQPSRSTRCPTSRPS
jgi:hypothetical protein